MEACLPLGEFTCPITFDTVRPPRPVWINGFGRGPYAGRAFSLGVHLTREHEPAFHGEARGRID